MAGAYTGVGQGILRVSADASETHKVASLRKAYQHMSRLYPDQTLHVTLTANVILRSTTEPSFSVYFGQSFGNAKSVFFGQEHDPVSGGISRIFSEFSLREASDLGSLPTRFTTEDFSAIYKRNFARSNVAVHRMISLVYLFAVGLENYERDHVQSSRTPLRIF